MVVTYSTRIQAVTGIVMCTRTFVYQTTANYQNEETFTRNWFRTVNKGNFPGMADDKIKVENGR